MNLRREMEEGVGGVEGGEKKLVTREMGRKTLGLEWRGKDLFCVMLYANFLRITSSVIWKISRKSAFSLIHCQ